MEAVIFVGIQASGKSSFYIQCFFRTHIRLNLDMLRTRNRLHILLGACIEAKQPFVIDNTNLTVEERASYIAAAKAAGFTVTGYFFDSSLGDSLRRNQTRTGVERIPVKGVAGAARRLRPPTYEEGFDRLYVVRIATDGFVVDEWHGPT